MANAQPDHQRPRDRPVHEIWQRRAIHLAADPAPRLRRVPIPAHCRAQQRRRRDHRNGDRAAGPHPRTRERRDQPGVRQALRHVHVCPAGRELERHDRRGRRRLVRGEVD